MAAHDNLNEHQTGEMVRRLKDPASNFGFTYDPRKKDFVKSGYAVAAHESAEMEVPDEGGITEAHLQGYIKGSAPIWAAGAQAQRPEGGSRAGRGKVMIGGWHNTADLPQVFPATPVGHAKSRESQVLRSQKASFAIHEGEEDPNPWSPRPPEGDEHADIGRMTEQFPEFAHMAKTNPRLALQQPEIQAWTQGPTRQPKRKRQT